MVITSRKSLSSGIIKLETPLDPELIINTTPEHDDNVYVVEYDIGSQVSDVFDNTVTLVVYATTSDIYVSAVGYLDQGEDCNTDADDLVEFSVAMSSEEKIKLLLAIAKADK